MIGAFLNELTQNQTVFFNTTIDIRSKYELNVHTSSILWTSTDKLCFSFVMLVKRLRTSLHLQKPAVCIFGGDVYFVRSNDQSI